jgi:hypothetical protein
VQFIGFSLKLLCADYIEQGMNKETNTLIFDKQGGETYKDLVILLREKSPRFAELIDKQVSALNAVCSFCDAGDVCRICSR